MSHMDQLLRIYCKYFGGNYVITWPDSLSSPGSHKAWLAALSASNQAAYLTVLTMQATTVGKESRKFDVPPLCFFSFDILLI